MNHRSARPRAAFTLVELLVVIGIIALLISILLPTLGRARKSARAIACSSNLRQNVSAMLMYTNDEAGWIPGAVATTGQALYTGSGLAPGINAGNVPKYLGAWDWIVPAADKMGIEYNDGPTLADRTERYNELVGGYTFLCPENADIQATAFGSTDVGRLQWNSYSIPISFLFETPAVQYGGGLNNPAGLTKAPKFGGDPALVLPGGFGPKVTKVGSSATKIMLADGARYIQGEAPTYNFAPVTKLGGNFSGWGSWSKFSNGWWRGKAVGNGGSGFDTRVLWGRHGGSDPALGAPGGAFESNYAFFDGHVEKLNDLEGSDPAAWLPVNSQVKQSEVWPDTFETHISTTAVGSDGYWTVAE